MFSFSQLSNGYRYFDYDYSKYNFDAIIRRMLSKALGGSIKKEEESKKLDAVQEEIEQRLRAFDEDYSTYHVEPVLNQMLQKAASGVKNHNNEVKLDELHTMKHLLEQQMRARDLKFDDVAKQNVFKTDQSSCFHRMFYGDPKLLAEFTALYQKFVQECVLPLIQVDLTRNPQRKFVVQTTPTFRVQIPGTSALGANLDIVQREVYIDKKVPDDAIGVHNDSMYKHPAGEINFILPLTNMFDTNSTWFETAVGSNEYKPITVHEKGKLFCFYGNNQYHFNKLNQTGKTRVSVDFRLMPHELYCEENAEASMSSGRAFKIGGYYTVLQG